MVILSIGIKPNTKLAQDAGIEIGATALKINDRMETNIPDIYAVGDVCRKYTFSNRKIRMDSAGFYSGEMNTLRPLTPLAASTLLKVFWGH